MGPLLSYTFYPLPCLAGVQKPSLLGHLKLTGPKVLTLSTVQAQSKWIMHYNELINTYYGLVGTKVRTEPGEHRSSEQWRVRKKSTLRLIQIASTLPLGFPYSRIQFTMADWRGLDPRESRNSFKALIKIKWICAHLGLISKLLINYTGRPQLAFAALWMMWFGYRSKSRVHVGECFFLIKPTWRHSVILKCTLMLWMHFEKTPVFPLESQLVLIARNEKCLTIYQLEERV